MTQTHSKKFHCTYLLHYYPFDTQVFKYLIVSIHSVRLLSFQICRVDLQLEEFEKDNVDLRPDTMEMLTDTELTQYYIQSWSLDFNDYGRYCKQYL